MRLYIGIDWSQSKHDLCFLNQAGSSVAQISIPHSQEGFWQIETMRQKLGVDVADCYVGLETAHTILVDFLWDQRYTQLYILHPNKVRSSRGRFRQSAARNDPSDALLIADREADIYDFFEQVQRQGADVCIRIVQNRRLAD